MMLASHALPGPFHDPLKREAQHYALSALPALCGTIATSLRLLAMNSGRDTPGTFGHFPLRVLQDEIGKLANFLHVSVSFVARFHGFKPMERSEACPTTDVSPTTFHVAQRT